MAYLPCFSIRTIILGIGGTEKIKCTFLPNIKIENCVISVIQGPGLKKINLFSYNLSPYNADQFAKIKYKLVK